MRGLKFQEAVAVAGSMSDKAYGSIIGGAVGGLVGEGADIFGGDIIGAGVGSATGAQIGSYYHHDGGDDDGGD